MQMQTTMTAVRVCRCESTAPACPILFLFIALTGDSSFDEQIQNTLHSQSYDSDHREPKPPLRGDLQLL
jgi:hypothetical protein